MLKHIAMTVKIQKKNNKKGCAGVRNKYFQKT